MYLQLAESGRTRVHGYKRKSHTVKGHWRALNDNGEETNPYIFIPDFTGTSKGYFIREDLLDDLTDDEFIRFMQQVEPYQPSEKGLSGFFSNIKDKLKARRERKEEKKEIRVEKKAAKVDRKFARNELIRARATAKAEGRGDDVFGSILDTVKNVASGIFGGGAETPGTQPAPAASFWDDTSFGISNKNLVIGGVGILAAGIAFSQYKKRRRRKR